MEMILGCQKCGFIEPIPFHCKQAMHEEIIDGEPHLVCWMGPTCGKEPMPKHCNTFMTIKNKEKEQNQQEAIKKENIEPKKVKITSKDKKSILKCQVCNFTDKIPFHCRQEMHEEIIDGEPHLVCWMGPTCGKEPMPKHCGKFMIFSEIDQEIEEKEEKDKDNDVKVTYTTKNHANKVKINSKVVNLAIEGMHCASCVATVENGLKKLEGISEVSINLVTEKAKIIINDSSKIDNETLIKAIQNVGYDARPLEEIETGKLKLNITGMHCASCVVTIENSIKNKKGINSVMMNLATEKGFIEYDSQKIKKTDIIATIESLGYGASEIKSSSNLVDSEKEKRHKEIRTQKIRLFSAIILSIPILIYSMLGMFISIPDPYPAELTPNLDPVNVFLFILTTPIMFFSGYQFHRSAVKVLSHRQFNMDVLVSLGTNAAYWWSLYSMIFLPDTMVFFESAAIVITFILLGKYLEARAKGQTSEAIKKLINLQAKTATVQFDNTEKEIPIEELQIGMIVLVKAGESLPSDGVVIEGKGFIDESMLTGESKPVEVNVESKVTGATILTNGFIKFRVEKTGDETALAQIIKLIEDAQTSKAPIQNIADIVAGKFVPWVIILASLTFIFWYTTFSINIFPIDNVPDGDIFVLSLRMMINVLVIACPCAMGLATPTAIMVATGKGASNGILIKGGESLETAHKIQTIVFDKTGTLTKGKPEVTSIHILNEKYSEKEILQYAMSAEQTTSHPLADAIITKGKGLNLSSFDITSSETFSGKGVKAVVDNHTVLIGSLNFLKTQGVNTNIQELNDYKEASDINTKVYMAVQQELVSIFEIADSLKDNSKQALNDLQKMGVEVYMITGDNYKTAIAVGKELGIKSDNIIAEVLPKDKVMKIKQLQSDNKIVAMVGDGINDGPALVQADVGIAIGTGTDVAIESGEIVLMKDDLRDVVNAISLSRKTITKIKQNLFWAFIYNIIGLPIAAGILFIPFGIMLTPEMAGAAMSFSSVSVVTNSLLLRRFNIN